MNQPKRWAFRDGGATLSERQLLRVAMETDVDPPDGADRVVWMAMAATLAAGVSGAGAAGGAGAASAGGAGANAASLSAAGSGAATSMASAAAGSTAAAGSKTAASAIAKTAANVGLVKGVLVGLVSTGLVVGAWMAMTPGHDAGRITDADAPRPATAMTAPIMRKAPDPVPVIEAPSPEVTSAPASDEPAASSASGPSKGFASAPAPRASATPVLHDTRPPSATAEPLADRKNQLRDESLLIGRARESMRAGDAPGALGLLEQARTRFPDGVLVQEREALAIETLYRSGQRAAASQRAAAFLRAYPWSPLAKRVQAFAD
jgi:hypothetical protein